MSTNSKSDNRSIPRILCYWDPSLGKQILGRLPDLAEIIWHAPDRQFLLEHLGEFDAYLASLHVQLEAAAIHAAAPRLRFVATPSTGLDHLDLEAMRQNNVRLLCIKEEFALLERFTSTAEQAWAPLLAVMRHLPAAHAAACKGEWARDRFRGHQISGKTLGILGVGRLGKMMVDYGRAFRMNVLGCDVKPFDIPGVRNVNLETLLHESDVLSIHIHLNEENRRFLNRERLKRMKPEAVLINTSRGAIVDEQALLEALESGHLSGAGLDVIEGEWRTDLTEHPLIHYAREHENLVISPHVGGITWEAQTMSLEYTANMLADAMKKG